MRRRQPPRRHACSRCVQLKVKCDVPGNGRICVRCARLRQRCHFPDKILPDKPKSRVDKLQEQVDSLVAELAKQRDGSAQASSNTTSDSSSPAGATHAAILQENPDARTFDPIENRMISLEEADSLLDKFRTHKMPQFPFVVIRQDETASTLRQKYPFLFLAVMTVCVEDNLSLYNRLELEVKKAISLLIVMHPGRDMDLVLGLLVHTAWNHYQWTVLNQQYLLLQIAVTLLVDLRLDKEGYFGIGDFRPKSSPAQDRYYELEAGKRALLGYYYLFSMSSLFRRQMFMRYTKWIDYCCQALADKPEYPSDSLLRTYIDIQLLAQKSEGPSGNGNGVCASCTPGLDFNAVQEQQNEIVRRFTTRHSLQGNWALFLHLKAMPTLILGQALRYQREVFNRDLNQLQTLASSTQGLLVAFLEIPPEVVVHLPTSSIATIWYSLLILSRLTLLGNEDWARGLNLDQEESRRLGFETLQRFGSLPKGADLWAHGKNIIGSRLSWLEKSKAEKQQSRAQPLLISTSTLARGSNVGTTALQQQQQNPLASSSALGGDLLQAGGIQGATGLVDGSVYAAATTNNQWPTTTTTSTTQLPLDATGTTDLYPSGYIDDQTQEFWPPSLWQGMFEDFLLSPSPTLQLDDFNLPNPGMFC